MPGMNSGVNVNAPTVVAAFRAAREERPSVPLLAHVNPCQDGPYRCSRRP
jgi:hypothetical protein